MLSEVLRSFKGYIICENGGYDDESELLKKTIISSKSLLHTNGNIYYISENGNDANDGMTPNTAWKTTEAIVNHYDKLAFGDKVLFERGCIFRLASRICVKSGISFGAYGEGEKPKIYGSLMNFAQEDLWSNSDVENVWEMKFPHGDVGNIIFENNSAVGIKKFSIEELIDNGDFYHDLDSNILYLKCSFGNPGSLFNNIEIAHYGNMFFVENFATDINFNDSVR